MADLHQFTQVAGSDFLLGDPNSTIRVTREIRDALEEVRLKGAELGKAGKKIDSQDCGRIIAEVFYPIIGNRHLDDRGVRPMLRLAGASLRLGYLQEAPLEEEEK